MMMTHSLPFKGTSSFMNTTKTISQLKREQLANKPTTYKFIETMFRSGNNFKYDVPNQQGSYKLKLSSFEVSTQEMSLEMVNHKNDLQYLKIQSDNMKRAFNEDYTELRQDLTEEINNFEGKLKMDFNHQKVTNLQFQKDVHSLTDDLLETKNKMTELKFRLAELKFKVNGENAGNGMGMHLGENDS